MARATGLAIRTSESAGGEYRHKYTDERGQERFFKLDGYIAARHGGRPIAIEFQGCYFHGHLAHMTPDTICANGKTAAMKTRKTNAA